MNFCALRTPANAETYLCGLLSFLLYHQNIRDGEPTSYREVDNISCLPDDAKLLSLNLYENSSVDIITEESVAKHVDKLSQALIHDFLYPEGVPEINQEDKMHLVLYRDETQVRETIENLGGTRMYYLPVFSWKSYATLNASMKDMRKHVYVHYIKSYREFCEAAPYIYDIVSKDEDLCTLAAQLLFFRGEEQLSVLKRARRFNNDTYQILIPENAVVKKDKVLANQGLKQLKESLKHQTDIYNFVLPSYGKDCGIADYHRHVMRSIERHYTLPPICITYNRVSDAIFYSDPIYVHHEYLLYSSERLMEDTHEELVEEIRQNSDRTFVVIFHTVPFSELFEENARARRVLELASFKNVIPVTLTRAGADHLEKNLKSKKSVLNIDIGMYELPKVGQGESNGPILMLGFASAAKGYMPVLEKVLKETKFDIQLVGKGTSVLTEMDPDRIKADDRYVPEAELLDYLGKAHAVVCNRTVKNYSGSASYRYAVSYGVPTIASDDPAHTSLLTYTGEGNLPFFESIDELPELLSAYSDPELRKSFFQTSQKLVREYSMGELFKRLHELVT